MKGISKRNNMVIYDHWSYMTILGILEVVFIALREEIKMEFQNFGELGCCRLRFPPIIIFTRSTIWGYKSGSPPAILMQSLLRSF